MQMPSRTQVSWWPRAAGMSPALPRREGGKGGATRRVTLKDTSDRAWAVTNSWGELKGRSTSAYSVWLIFSRRGLAWGCRRWTQTLPRAMLQTFSRPLPRFACQNSSVKRPIVVSKAAEQPFCQIETLADTKVLASYCETFSDQGMHHAYLHLHDYLAFRLLGKRWVFPWHGVSLSQRLSTLGFWETVHLPGKSPTKTACRTPKPWAGQAPLQCHEPEPATSNQATVFPAWGHVQHVLGSRLLAPWIQLVLFCVLVATTVNSTLLSRQHGCSTYPAVMHIKCTADASENSHTSVCVCVCETFRFRVQNS